MKQILLTLFFSFLLLKIDAQMINEIHYDNTGNDVNESIEVIAPRGTNVSALTVELYNGNGGGTYGSTLSVSTWTKTQPSCTIGGNSTDVDIYVIVLPANGLQNGAPDGLALIDNGTVIEFLSYEGTFTATNGSANGMTSTDIGVSQNGAPLGESLQRTSSGWAGPSANTFGACNPNQAALPIDLVSFNAEVNDSKALLSWQTASEQNNDYFSIEHSTDGRKFSSIGMVQGAGNSVVEHNYEFVHKSPSKGVNYYRLAQYDFDGNDSYSHVASVYIGGRQDWFLTPTQTQDVLTVNWNESNVSAQEIVIYNLAGQMVYSQKVGPNADRFDINTSNLIDGLYLVQITSGKNISTQKFQKI